MILMKNGSTGFGKAWLMVALISWTQLSLAQDPHFSQYISAPLLLNPAQAGLINGSYRINLNYRDQWNKIEGSDYKTVAFSGDMNFIPPLKGFRNDLMGIGLSFLSDKSPGFDFNTNELAMYVAYHKRTGKNQFLSFGTKLGILQRGVNYENLTFGDQYVEGSGYSNNSREVLPENNISSTELSLGLNYSWSASESKGLTLGISMHHITSPDFSFFNLSPPLGIEPIKQPLYGLLSFHATGAMPMSGDQMVFMPRIWILNQGPHFQLNTGALIKLPLNQDGNNSLYAGGYLRLVKGVKSVALESFVPHIAFGLGSVNLGLSYDANLRRFAPSYFQQSVFELSIALIGNYDNASFFCPRF